MEPPVEREADGPSRATQQQHRDSRRAPATLIRLQQSAGNRAVSGLLVSRLSLQRHEGPSFTEEDGGGSGAPSDQSGQTGTDQRGTESAASQQGNAGGGGGGAAGTPDGMDVVTPNGQPAPDQTPTPGPAGRPSGGAPVVDNATKWAQIQSSLSGHPHGVWATSTVAALGTGVLVNSTAPGSFFAPSENKIHLNRSLTAPTAASVFVHEAFHAWSSRTHHTADIRSLSRADYVTAMVNEETTAVINQISLVTEQGATSAPGGVPSAAMYTAYSRAWQKAHDAASGDEAAKKAAGDAAGRKVVNGWFYDGTFVTSTTNQPYATYYGQAWDGVHKPPAHR